MHRVGQVWAVKAGPEHLPLFQAQLFDNIPPDPLSGGGSQGNYRDAGEVLPHCPQVPVIRPELVPPLRYAVGFVNGDQARSQPLQEPPEPGLRQAFRRRVENLDLTPQGQFLHRFNLRAGQRAVDEPGRNPVGVQRVHLVLHQCDQG